MKRFETVPLTKLLVLYSLVLIIPITAFYLARIGLHWIYLVPLLLLISFVFVLFGAWSRIHVVEALRKLEKALQTTRVGVTITDIEGKIIYVNSAEARMHGYDPEELAGKNVRIFAAPDIWEVNPPGSDS